MSAATLTVQTPELQSFQEELSQFGVVGRAEALQAMGAALKLTLVEHLSQLDQDSVHHRWASKLGADSTHFYGSAVGSVQLPQIERRGEVSVSINNIGLAQRYFGGVIAPREKKWITIPAVAEAYGKRAGSFNNLQFINSMRFPAQGFASGGLVDSGPVREIYRDGGSSGTAQRPEIHVFNFTDLDAARKAVLQSTAGQKIIIDTIRGNRLNLGIA